MTYEERKEAISNLVNLYETDLKEVLATSHKFELNRLPQHIQDIIEVVTAKAPNYSNVAALATANYAISHVIGQCRPLIDDLVFSSDRLIINTYSVIISGSGSGKSSSTNGLLKAFQPALDLVNGERMKAQIEVAKNIAYRELSKDEPTLTIDQVQPQDYEQYLKPLPRTVVSSSSTRGGVNTLLSKLQSEKFSSLGLTFDELGMSLKSGPTTAEVMHLLTEAFDIGNIESPEFKNVEVKETSISGMAINLLAHSSPKIIFSTDSVRDQLSMLFSTSFARRAFFFFPDQDETVENNVVPDTIEASRNLAHARREIVAHKTPDISDNMTKAVERLLVNEENRLVKFDHSAATLYADYYEYCQRKAELLEDSSILQIELSGRSFRLGKLAAVWSLAGGSSTITRDIMEAVIYLAEYSNKYLQKFVKLTTAKPYELLADVFLSGKQTYITLDSALTNGYISRVTPTFAELIEPLNSVLRKDGICSYNEDIKTFVYSPFKKVEETPSDKPNCGYSMSYILIEEDAKISLIDAPAHLIGKDRTDWVKEKRKPYLLNFDRYRSDLCFDNIKNLLTRDSIFNPFEFKDDDKATMHRHTDNIISSTKLIILDVDKSDVDLYAVHDYLEEYNHLIATTSDITNKRKFRIILPINVELDGSNTKQYAFVVKRVAAELLLNIDTASAVAAQAFYGYKDAEVLTVEDKQLFDITEFLNEYASDEEVKPVKQLVKNRSPKARKAHVEKIMGNMYQVFHYAFYPESNWSFQLIRAAKHARDEGFTYEEIMELLNFINSTWEIPMKSERFSITVRNQVESWF